MNWSAVGAAALALGVMIGAFGAHALRDRFDAYRAGIYERAVFYHFVHAFGMLILPLFAKAGALSETSATRIALVLCAGILLFSGSLYVLAVTGIRTLGIVTPFGGVAFIAGWLMLAWCLARK